MGEVEVKVDGAKVVVLPQYQTNSARSPLVYFSSHYSGMQFSK